MPRWRRAPDSRFTVFIIRGLPQPRSSLSSPRATESALLLSPSRPGNIIYLRLPRESTLLHKREYYPSFMFSLGRVLSHKQNNLPLDLSMGRFTILPPRSVHLRRNSCHVARGTCAVCITSHLALAKCQYRWVLPFPPGIVTRRRKSTPSLLPRGRPRASAFTKEIDFPHRGELREGKHGT